ncbi:MAG: DNA mismatch repair endonuclease MutL [Hyphomicrobiaceae bacterium]|nr:DNA mismatch repair endonuclease MutL [Hyphomicrobiaceae bacterium]
MVIRQLEPQTINRIAAGEVIDRPASVVKELIENAIDAGARNIEVVTRGGGIALTQVNDDGVGMIPSDLELAVERHTTSKLRDEELLDIRTLGFRGEALPSIASIARLSITTRARNSAESFEIVVDRGVRQAFRPAAVNSGTRVEVRELFSATPARLKFLKSERVEHLAINDTLKRLAMAHPEIGFSLTTGERRSLKLAPATRKPQDFLYRIGRIIGREFVDDALALEGERDGIYLHGFCSLPTLNRADSTMQFLFVNGRPVRDKLLVGAIRGAYGDLLPRGRFPLIALFVDLEPGAVDVNVHPAKTEVRFRSPGIVRHLIVAGLRSVLNNACYRASASGGITAIDKLARGSITKSKLDPYKAVDRLPAGQKPNQSRPNLVPGGMFRASIDKFPGSIQASFNEVDQPSAYTGSCDHDVRVDKAQNLPLGAARAQIHENYIVAQTEDSMIIVDQHAAHERIIYERIKASLTNGAIASQGLLIPVVVTLDAHEVDFIIDLANYLAKLGLVLERFGTEAVVVREVPTLLGRSDVTELVRDIAAELRLLGTRETLSANLNAMCAVIACHGSIRSGRRLCAQEMNALLRDMEKTPGSGQCNHGRPTYIELKLHDIEKLFARR